jgi:NCAIR mutase (PurE)-related protein
MRGNIDSIVRQLRSRHTSRAEALRMLRTLPYEDLGFAKIDNHRRLRRGFPEVIFGKGKTPEQVVHIAKRIIAHDGILLITRTSREVYEKLKTLEPRIRYWERAGAITFRAGKARPKKGKVLVITAGTADMPVAEEAVATLDVMGDKVKALYDVGVAGIHRILDKREVLEKADVVIVVAGMEGALASVVSGLVSKPVVAVPTSVGYGASFEGIAPLLTMMNSCSPGVSVVNIDNGFGAGYFASIINK